MAQDYTDARSDDAIARRGPATGGADAPEATMFELATVEIKGAPTAR